MFGGKLDRDQEVAPQIDSSASRSPVLGQVSQTADFLNSGDSIIGSDLVISAQDLIVISQTSLQLHGKTMGEVRATEIVIGESALITGTVIAETVVIHGEVQGTVRASNVSLTATARVEGAIYHHSFEIARGAVFHGQSFYEPVSANLLPKLDAA